MTRRGPAFLLLLTLVGCAELPVIADDQCGNYVIDDGEDCDTYAVHPGTSCRMSTPDACRYECAARDDGTRPDCAPGMQCGADGLCRAPSGNLDWVGAIDAPGARELLVADVGGSPGAEVLAVLERRIELTYLSLASDLEVLARITEPSAADIGTVPLPADLSADGVTDLITPFAGGWIANLGGPEYKLAPSAHPGLALRDIDAVAMVFLEVLPQRPGSETLTFASIGGAGALAYSENFEANLLTVILGSPADLAGPMAVGQLDEDPVTSPCDEVALALVGKTDVLTVVPCRPALGGGVEWNALGAPLETALPPGRTIARGPLLVDLNDDDHLDLLVEVQGCADCPELMASFGRGDGTFHSQAAEVETVAETDKTFASYAELRIEKDGQTGPPLRSLPLAMGDLDGDGVQDFVTDHEVCISRGSTSKHSVAAEVSSETWSLSCIADFNENGRLDVVAVTSGATGMRFFNGAPGGLLNEAFIPTTAPIGQIAVGDFDGDLVLDLATSQPRQAFDESAGDLVSIHFGRAAGAPEPPVVIGRLDPVVQLAVGRAVILGVLDGIDDLTALAQAPDGSFVLSGFNGRVDRLIRSPFLLSTQYGFHFVGYPPRRMAVGQFDDDPHPDLAVLALPWKEPDYPSFLWLAAATGAARFDLAHALHSHEDQGLGPGVDFARAAMVAVDVDDDGRDEVLLVAPRDAGGTLVQLFEAVAWEHPTSHEDIFWISRWAHEVPWAFSRSEEFGPVVPHNGRLLLVDVDGRGHEEVVALGSSPEGMQLWHLAGLSLDSLGEVRAIEVGAASVRDAAVVEADGDPGQELVLLSDDGVYWLGVGHAGLAGVSEAIWEVAGGERIAVGDVDGDGLEDVVVADGSVASILRARPENP